MYMTNICRDACMWHDVFTRERTNVCRDSCPICAETHICTESNRTPQPSPLDSKTATSELLPPPPCYILFPSLLAGVLLNQCFYTLWHIFSTHTHTHTHTLSLSLSLMSDYFISPCKRQCGLWSAGCPGTHRRSLSSNVGRSNGVIFCIFCHMWEWCRENSDCCPAPQFHIQIETGKARERENERDWERAPTVTCTFELWQFCGYVRTPVSMSVPGYLLVSVWWFVCVKNRSVFRKGWRGPQW